MQEKLLFVCMGNICRSPSAEGVMRHLLAEAGLDGRVTVASAGTIGYHAGEPADRRMRYTAAQRGIDLDGHVARQFGRADFETYDRILAMDRANYEDILALDPEGRYHHKVKLICDYCSRYTDREVPDPYYGGEAGFRYVLDLLFDACAGLLAEVRRAHVEQDR